LISIACYHAPKQALISRPQTQKQPLEQERGSETENQIKPPKKEKGNQLRVLSPNKPLEAPDRGYNQFKSNRSVIGQEERTRLLKGKIKTNHAPLEWLS